MSCTGSQFCPLGLVETKNRALQVVRKLEEQLDIPSMVRMHWTGCPNSCGQVRVGVGRLSCGRLGVVGGWAGGRVGGCGCV